jgi:hypothetical protein
VISNGETIATRAAEGALAGGLIGAFTGPGAIVGAGAGGMLGAAEGFMETYGHGVGMDKGGSYSSPGKTGRPAQPIVVKPQPITLNLNVDGRALASAVTDAMGNQTGFSTQAPAADGLGIFGSGDHDYKDH